MITVMSTISHGANAVRYCARGGEILVTNMCLGSAKEITQQMEQNNAFNTKCKKQFFHIKIRIAPEDKGKLSTQDWVDITRRFSIKMGFQKNPYAVYMHEENTDKEHCHIVVARIDENNRAVPDNYTHIRCMDFSREMERRYRLREVHRKLETFKKQEIFVPNNAYKERLRVLIHRALESSKNMIMLTEILNCEGVKVKIGRGVTFIDEYGVKFKGSSLDRKLSLGNIKKTLEQNKVKKESQQTQTFETSNKLKKETEKITKTIKLKR